jgi:hypothetical protein
VALPLNVFKTVTHVATTGAVGIYTAPTGYTGVVLMAQAANVHGTDTTDITFSHKRSSTVTEIVKDFAISANDSVNLISGRLVIEPSDSIEVSASAASKIKITVSILETLN